MAKLDVIGVLWHYRPLGAWRRKRRSCGADDGGQPACSASLSELAPWHLGFEFHRVLGLQQALKAFQTRLRMSTLMSCSQALQLLNNFTTEFRCPASSEQARVRKNGLRSQVSFIWLTVMLVSLTSCWACNLTSISWQLWRHEAACSALS